MFGIDGGWSHGSFHFRRVKDCLDWMRIEISRHLTRFLKGLDGAAAPFHTTTALAAAIHNTEVRAPAAQGMYLAYLECGV